MPVTAIPSLDDFHIIIESGKPVVIDLWATWCGPCRMISPVFEDYPDADENKQVEFYKVNVDDLPEIAKELDVTALPTFALFQNGKVLDMFIGTNRPEMRELIAKGVQLG